MAVSSVSQSYGAVVSKRLKAQKQPTAFEEHFGCASPLKDPNTSKDSVLRSASRQELGGEDQGNLEEEGGKKSRGT